ncbi:transglycosylase SLT domain-containing protein [Rhodobacteraceae bacterium M385]|nr:transglycosylase SLT domain-containing protein [Rhodobacteraceae bacterium M385]
MYIASGFAAVTASAPGLAFGQVEAVVGAVAQGAAVEVTSAVAGPDGSIEAVPSGAAPLLHVPRDGDGAPEVAILPDVEDDAPEISDLAPDSSLRPVVRDSWAVPAARWDDHPRGPRWTAAVLSALRGPGAPLLETEPDDINTWCPGYLNATPEQRAAFWTGLISALAWHESTHNPSAVGGGGQWFGLVQISPGTARWRDCDVGSGEALLNGAANLRCGVRIMGVTVPRDNVVSEGMRGVAADWGPFHSARKREDMRNWVREQEYCQASVPQIRPVMRPEGASLPMLDDAPVLSPHPASAQRARPVPRPVNL